MKALQAKSIWTMAVLLCLALLSACGSSGNNAAPSGAASTGASESGVASASAEMSKPVTITMMVSGTKAADGQDFVLDIMPKLVKQKFPNVTLETSKLPDDQYMTSVRTKLAAGQGPDIFLIFPKNSTMGTNDMAKSGFAADLSDLKFWDNVSKGAKDDMSYDGKPYAISGGISFLGTYYNKEMFDKVGITSIPQDWNAFLEACHKLKDAGITPIVMGDKDPWNIQFGMYQIASNVVYPDEMDFDNKLQAGENSLADPKWIKTISMYKELYDKGYIVKNSLGIGSAQAAQSFVDGKAAMIFDGTWDYPVLTAKGAGGEFTRGFFALPANDPGKPVFVSGATSAGYGINAKSKNIAIAKEILNYWFDGQSELFQEFMKTNSAISVYKGVPLNFELFKEINDYYQQSGNSVYFPNQMWPAGVAEEMEAKFASIIGGRKTTADDVAKAMDAKFKELWKN